MRKLKKKHIHRELLIEKFNPTYTNEEGTAVWLNKNGLIHRDGDKPAVFYSDGTICWFKNGKEYIPNKIKKIGDRVFFKEN